MLTEGLLFLGVEESYLFSLNRTRTRGTTSGAVIDPKRPCLLRHHRQGIRCWRILGPGVGKRGVMQGQGWRRNWYIELLVPILHSFALELFLTWSCNFSSQQGEGASLLTTFMLANVTVDPSRCLQCFVGLHLTSFAPGKEFIHEGKSPFSLGCKVNIALSLRGFKWF